jgi:hypothetical protein
MNRLLQKLESFRSERKLHQFIVHLFTTTSRPLVLRQRLTEICYDADCWKDDLREDQSYLYVEMEDPTIDPNRHIELSERIARYVEGIHWCEMIYAELRPYWYVPHAVHA